MKNSMEKLSELEHRLAAASPAEVAPLVRSCFEFIRDFEGDIPGAAPRDCGNWRDQNIDFAHWYARRYLEETLYGIDDRHLEYPA